MNPFGTAWAVKAKLKFWDSRKKGPSLEGLRAELRTLRSPAISIFLKSFLHALSSAPPRNLGLQPAALARLKVKRVLLSVRDDTLSGYLSLKAPDCAFNTLVVVNLNSRHSNLHAVISVKYETQLLYQSACINVNADWLTKPLPGNSGQPLTHWGRGDCPELSGSILYVT